MKVVSTLYIKMSPPPLAYSDTPVGSVMAFAGDLGRAAGQEQKNYVTSPIEAWGWMFCDGRSLTCSEYAELFMVLGYRYGGGGEVFNLPDYRGYFLRGTDADSGHDPDLSQRYAPGDGGDDSVGSMQADALQCHRHSYTMPIGSVTAGLGAATAVLQSEPEQCSGYPDELVCNEGVKTSEKETRPVNVYVNYIIKFTYGPGCR